MNGAAPHSPKEWFRHAAFWYVEGHQACAACRASYCVSHTATEAVEEFYCQSCDFSVCLDHRTGRHYVWEACTREPHVPAALLALAAR